MKRLMLIVVVFLVHSVSTRAQVDLELQTPNHPAFKGFLSQEVSDEEKRILFGQYDEILKEMNHEVFVTTPWLPQTLENSPEMEIELFKALAQMLKERIESVFKGTVYEGYVESKTQNFFFERVCIETETHADVVVDHNIGSRDTHERLNLETHRSTYTNRKSYGLAYAEVITNEAELRALAAAASDTVRRTNESAELKYARNTHHDWDVFHYEKVNKTVCKRWIILGQGRAKIQILPQRVIQMKGPVIAYQRLIKQIDETRTIEKLVYHGLPALTKTFRESMNSGPHTLSNGWISFNGREVTPGNISGDVRKKAQALAINLEQNMNNYLTSIEVLQRDFGGLHPTADIEILQHLNRLKKWFDRYQGRQLAIKYTIDWNGLSDAEIEEAGYKDPHQTYVLTVDIPTPEEIESRIAETIGEMTYMKGKSESEITGLLQKYQR